MRRRSNTKPIPVESRRQSTSRTPPAPTSLRTQRSVATPSSFASLNNSNSSDPLIMNCDKCETGDFLLVSKCVTKWETLFRHLMEPEDVGDMIHQLAIDNRSLSVVETCMKALEKWKKKRGADATFEHLVHALVACSRTDVAEKLMDSRRNSGRCPEVSFSISSISSHHSSFYDVSCVLEYDENDNVFAEAFHIQKKPCEVGKLKNALKNPQITVISLAGPQNSGKTVTLNILQQQLENDQSFARTKIIKVRSTEQVDFNWLSREIVRKIGQAPRQDSDQSSYAASGLVGLLDNHDDIVLILDLSLIALSDDGKAFIDELLGFRKKETLAKRLRIIISTLTSLWKTSLFLQDRKSFEEITVQPIEHNEAVKYISKINESFPKQVASAIVRKIDCYPFYLRQIADADIKTIFVCDESEEIVRAVESNFEELNELLFDANVEKAVSTVFGCLSEDKKALLTQVLVFANCFGLEQAQRIVDHEIDINDSLFNPLCEQGVLFLKRDRTSSKVNLYHIPKIQGDMLRKIVSRSDQFSEMYHKALSIHQGLYLQLLVLLSNCFMGDAPSKSEELNVLEPFTPSDGVPAHQSLTIKDVNERTSRAVNYFRQQHDDIMKSLLYCNRSQTNYKAVVEVITQLNVYYFLTHMMCSHESLKIYRKLKREATCQKDQESLAKLNVFIASLSIDANGQNEYLSEANSLYEPSVECLRGNVYAHCIQRMGGNMLLESRQLGDLGGQWKSGSEHISNAKDLFRESGNGKEATKVYIADCSRLFEDISGKFNTETISQIISTCSEVLGSRHPITCSCLMIKGKMYQTNGEFNAAMKIFQEVIDIEEELLGQHWHTARALFQLAVTLFEKLKRKTEEQELRLSERPPELRIQNAHSLPKTNTETLFQVEMGVELQEETGMQELPGSDQRRAAGSENLIAANQKLVTKQSKAHTLPKGIAKPKANNKKETVTIDNQKVLYERSSSTSGSITITPSPYEKFGGTAKIIRRGEDTEIDVIKNLLEKAAEFSLHANGKCKDAQNCYLKLNEISRWNGRSEDAKRFMSKAKLCSNTA